MDKERLSFVNINEYVMVESNLMIEKNHQSKNIDNENQILDIELFLCFLKEKYNEDEIFHLTISSLLNCNSSSDRMKTKTIYLLSSLLKKKNIDYRLLRRLSFEGIPDDFPGVRSIIWKIMLNHLSDSQQAWKDYCIYQKSSYDNIKSTFLDETGNYPSCDNYLLGEIVKDIKRTRTHMHFFSTNSALNNNETHSDILVRILFVFGKIHSDIAYVQGMNELVAVIYYCFCKDPNPFFIDKLESEVFYCFENLMLELKEVFLREKDDSESGVHNRINNISYLLESIDPELYYHFKKENVELEYFMFRWYTLLFTQEFSMPDTLRLWDAILTQNDKFEFVSYLCLAIVVMNKKILLKKDFSNIMYVMQKLDLLEINIEILLTTAVDLKSKLSHMLKFLSLSLI